MIEKEKKDFWDEFSDFQKEEIQQGIKDLDEGRRISWEDLKKELNKLN